MVINPSIFCSLFQWSSYDDVHPTVSIQASVLNLCWGKLLQLHVSKELFRAYYKSSSGRTYLGAVIYFPELDLSS